MDMDIKGNFMLGLVLVLLLVACRSGEDNGNSVGDGTLSKDERLDLFLADPLEVNSNIDEQVLNNIKFRKHYLLAKNEHSDQDRDSILKEFSDSYVVLGDKYFSQEKDTLIRLSSAKDVVDILKNKYTERIVYMNMNSKGLKLNYGLYLGMARDSFNKLLPLKINKEHVASYVKEEFFEVEFVFDKENGVLKNINYRSIID